MSRTFKRMIINALVITTVLLSKHKMIICQVAKLSLMIIFITTDLPFVPKEIGVPRTPSFPNKMAVLLKMSFSV